MMWPALGFRSKNNKDKIATIIMTIVTLSTTIHYLLFTFYIPGTVSCTLQTLTFKTFKESIR